MKHLTAVLVLVLASTNASKYFSRDNQHQQVDLTTTKNSYQNSLPLNLEDRFLHPIVSVEEIMANKWESPQEPRLFFYPDLDVQDNLLQEDPDDRVKRMKASLSIDNPLDVLRQQYFRALARRMKYKSIEKNREHLIKTGKRSPIQDSVDYQTQLGKPSDFLKESTLQNHY